MALIQHFFAGPFDMHRRLADEVQRRMESSGYTSEVVDAVCALGTEGLPSCTEVLKDPACLTSETFNRLSSFLGIQIDEVLSLDFDENKLALVLQDMKDTGARLVAACGGDPKNVSEEEVARVYVHFRLLDELDAVVESPDAAKT